MHKRTSTGAISSPTAEAGFGANVAARELAAWAERLGVEPHSPEAQHASDVLAAKEPANRGPADVRTKPASTAKGKGNGKR
jgi:hypothetical protein